MRLNADILYNELAERFDVGSRGSFKKELTLKRPVFYHSGDGALLSDQIYICRAEELTDPQTHAKLTSGCIRYRDKTQSRGKVQWPGGTSAGGPRSRTHGQIPEQVKKEVTRAKERGKPSKGPEQDGGRSSSRGKERWASCPTLLSIMAPEAPKAIRTFPITSKETPTFQTARRDGKMHIRP